MRDHASAALLGIVTERIANLRPERVTLQQVHEALDVALYVRDDFAAYMAKLRTVRDDTRSQVDLWRHRAAAAEACGEPHLAARALERAADRERLLGNALGALSECAAGQQRLGDAITELRHLAARLERARDDKA
jgi:hypothetical protein